MITKSFLFLNKTARAVIIGDEKILLCREKGGKWCFLPGWRVSPGQKTEDTLHSNIHEELGSKISDLEYIGAISNHYQVDKYKSHQEFDLVYLVKLQENINLSENNNVEFLWHEIATLETKNVMPRVLGIKLIEWLSNKKIFWASIERR